MAKAQLFRLEDFSGGYNPDRSETLIEANQATAISNFRLDQMGSLVSRDGYLQWAQLAPYPTRALGALIDPNNLGNSRVTIALATGDTLITPGGDVSSMRTRFVEVGAPSIGKPEFMAAQNRMFLCSGVALPVSFTLTEYGAPLGIKPPTATPTTTVSSGGSLDEGLYRYVYTAYRTADGHESNPSPELSATTTSGNLTVSFTLPSAPSGYRYRVYRTDVDSLSRVFKFLGEFDGLDLVTNDGSVPTSDLAAPADHDVPVFLEHLAFYNGRYFGAKGDKLYWSYPLNYDYWPALNVTTMPFQGNDTIQALVAFQDTLVVFGKRNTLLVTGTQDDNSVMGSWQIVRLDVDLGVTSPNAVAEIGNQLLFLADTGLHVYPGFSPFASHIQRELTAIPYTAKATALLGYIPQERSVWLTVGGKTYTVHVPNQAVSFYSIVPSILLPGGRRGNDAPIFVTSASNLLYEYGGENDLGNPIPVKWVSKEFHVGTPESVKYFRRIGAFATKGAGSIVTITVRDRGEMFSVLLSQVSGLGETQWNEFQWNEADWAGAGLAYFIAALPAQRLIGRSMQIEIAAELEHRIEISPPVTLLFREANRLLGV